MPKHPASPTPFESQTLHPAKAKTLPPLSKAKPSYPAKAIFGRIFAPAKNPSRTLQAPAKPRTPTKKAPPGKPVIQASVRRFVIAM